MKIENENIFKDILKSGSMNLFIGAGFSILASNSEKESLPLGFELRNKIITHFDLSKFTNRDLPFVCSHLKRNKQGEFSNYIKDSYTVCNFDNKYSILSFLPIRNIFTTNVDDLIEKIFYSHPNNKIVQDVEIVGSSENNGINLFKLHGSVTYPYDREMIFGTEELVTTLLKDNTLFNTVAMKVASIPTLFWGTNLNDPDILHSLSAKNVNYRGNQPKWIIILGDEQYDIDADEFRSGGFRIIRSNTEEFIDYLSFMSKEIISVNIYKKDSLDEIRNNFTRNYITTLKEIKHPVRPISSFYQGSDPTWYDIFADKIPKISFYEKALDLITNYKLSLISGSPGCGKTTLLMQLFASNEIQGEKFYFNYLTENRAKLFIKLTSQFASIVVFLDNLSDNIDSFRLLVGENNIKIVSAERDFSYEQVRYHSKIANKQILDISNLEDYDVQRICNSMERPVQKFYKEKVSLFEIVYKLWIGSEISDKIASMIKDFIEKKDPYLIEFYTFLVYMRYTNISASIDMLLSYYSDDTAISFKNIYAIKEQINSLIDDAFVDDDVQDYFTLRSRAFAEVSIRYLPSNILSKVLIRFHKNLHRSQIIRFDVFKKRAYDADLATKAFIDVEEGKYFYSYLLSTNNIPRDTCYIKHQFSIYLWRKGAKEEAWEIIDSAYTQAKGKIYSISNTHAMILFDNNIDKISVDKETSVETLIRSFDVLEDCLMNDDRKSYHLIRYIDQSIKFHEAVFNESSFNYLLKSKDYIEHELSDEGYIPQNVFRNLKEKQKKIMDYLKGYKPN